MSEENWKVVADYLAKLGYPVSNTLRNTIEQLEITEFDAGVFIAKGPKFDLFVKPEKRGKWNIRGIFGGYVNDLVKKHGQALAGINERNKTSLRLAKGFGFVETSRNNGVIQLRRTWVI